MDRVRSALADHDQLAAHGHAILGGEIIGDDFVLLDSIHPHRVTALGRGVASIDCSYWRAIKGEIVGTHGRPVSTVRSALLPTSVTEVFVLRNARLQQAEVEIIASVQRQVGHLLLVY